MMNRKTLWFSLILLVGAGLSLLFMVTRDTTNSNSKRLQGINAFMTQPSYREYNAQGQLHSQLHAISMHHFVNNDVSFFDNPRILIYTDDRIPWHIRSHYGRSQDGTTKVLLYHKVKLVQPGIPQHPKTIINTTELYIYPKQSFAESSEKVTIQQPGSIVRGKGIKANFKKGTIRLLKQSRGTYEPDQNTTKVP